MRVGLIDVDAHNYPNLCLMKLSSYHKSIGDTVEWWDESAEHYDVVYMSKVFSDQYSPDLPDPQNASSVIRGGTGYAIWLEGDREVYHKENDKPLPTHIEHCFPDYSLYPEYTGYGKPLKQQTAYGFLTRGCPRGCGFCHVAPKEGKCSTKVADLSEFWNGQGTICLSDPNILACKNWRELLQQLVDSEAKIKFNQGLDARLITPEKAELLASMNLILPHFAMDSMEVMKSVSKGLRLYVEAYKRIHGKWNWRYAKVFCLTNFDTDHDQDMQRIEAIRSCECYPYVMIYNKPSAPQITRRLARWTNHTAFYSQFPSFSEYLRSVYKTHDPEDDKYYSDIGGLTMTAETRVNIFEKLSKIRQEFWDLGAKKSGVNSHSEFLYYELSDFIQPATEVLTNNRCTYYTNFPDDKAVGTLVSWDTDEKIVFNFNMRNIAEPAKFRMNEAQSRGAELTYYRRYLWYLLLDFSNADEFDNRNRVPAQEEAPTPAPKKSKKPATPKERKEIKEELTAQADPADDLQLGALMSALNTLLDKDPDQEEFAQNLAQMTNGFTEITKEQCEAIINGIQDMLGQYED